MYVCDITTQHPTPVLIHSIDNTQWLNNSIGSYNGVTYVAFEDKNDQKCDIKLYNCDTGITKTVTSSEYIERHPVLQNEFLVYRLVPSLDSTSSDDSDYRWGGEVMLYEISANPPQPPISIYSCDSQPGKCEVHIGCNPCSDDKIVMASLSMSTDKNKPPEVLWDILVYDVSESSIETVHSASSSDGDSLLIACYTSGNDHLIYRLKNNKHYYLYLYDYNTKTNVQVAEPEHGMGLWRMSLDGQKGYFIGYPDHNDFNVLYKFDIN